MNDTPGQDILPSGEKRKRSLAGRLFLILLPIFLVAGGFAAWDIHRFLTTPAGGDNPETVLINIIPGSTFDRVAWDLYKAGAITDVDRFRLLARFHKQLGSIQAGEFEVDTGWTPDRVLNHLTSGRPVMYRLALREGLPWWDVAKLVEEGGFATAEAFKAVIHDPEFLRRWGIPFTNAEGFLFPDTYHLRKPREMGGRAQAEEIAAILVESFWRRTWELWEEYARTAGEAPGSMTAVEALTLADGTLARRQRGQGMETFPPAMLPVSPDAVKRLVILSTLVEKETGVAGERARVAGVYANRLRIGMLLQCDPTIIYGLGESFSGPIRKSHLADVKNPYNTYQHAGLPPGPICSAGLAAITGAIQPESHKYLYFVAKGGDGSHEFSTNLNDHLRAVANYRAWERSRQ